MVVTIVGAGVMGRAIAALALTGEHSVRLVDSDEIKAKQLADDLGPAVRVAGIRDGITGADILVLATPYPAGRRLADELGAALAGLTVVDICNPVDFSTFDGLLTVPGMSAAEEIAAASPAAHVVKAFNMNFASALLDGEVAGAGIDVFIAGDHAEATARVATLVRDGGLRPVLAGPLRRARELESFQFLHMTLQEPLALHWSSAIKLLP